MWAKIDTLNNEVGELEDCPLYNDYRNQGCRGCSLEKNCKKISNRFYADIEIEKLNKEMRGIFSELGFLRRERDFHNSLEY